MDISTPVGKLPPPPPPKDQVIPVHTSDRAAFKRCRRYWDWSSPMRESMRPNPRIHGVSLPLWFGTGIHLALEHFYNPYISRDPVETFLTWYDIQTIGGMISREQWEQGFAGGLPDIVELDICEGVPMTFAVKGLFDIMPDPDPTEFEAHKALGIGMMEFYKEYAAKNDSFAVIAAEHDFSVPMYRWLNSDGKLVMYIHPADDPATYKPVHYRGRMDLIIQDLETGRYGIMDHKTAAPADGEEYVKKLVKDEQVTSYIWAAEQEARIHDLEYKQIDFVLYNTLWKLYPKPPDITASTKNFPQGRPSIDRNKATTAALWYQAVKDRDLDWWVENDEKAAAYAKWLLDSGDGLFIRRDLVRRNRAEIHSAGERILDEVHDMLAADIRIYPNPTAHWSCLRCAFRDPCIARDDGSDWESMIEDNYIKTWDR